MERTHRTELIKATEVYAEELQREIEKNTKELNRVNRLNLAYKNAKTDEEISELDLALQKEIKEEKIRNRESRKLNSIEEPCENPRDYVPNKKVLAKIRTAYNKSSKRDSGFTLNNSCSYSFEKFHRPLKNKYEGKDKIISWSDNKSIELYDKIVTGKIRLTDEENKLVSSKRELPERIIALMKTQFNSENSPLN